MLSNKVSKTQPIKLEKSLPYKEIRIPATHANFECDICFTPINETLEKEHKRHSKLPTKYWFTCKKCTKNKLNKLTKTEIIDLMVN